MITLSDVANAVNYPEAEREIEEFLSSYVLKAGAKGVVVGLSGGVDSSVTASLAARALGPERVMALILPSKATPQSDVDDAVRLARSLGVRYRVVEVDPVLKAYEQILPEYDGGDLIARGNLTARIRMAALYYYANRLDYLVAGTGDKSELMLGYFTKYGDGGVDLLPIGDLYKTQVRMMAKHLGIPDEIALKPSSPRLWVGQTAEGELGVKYGDIDLVLYARELGIPPDAIPANTGVPPDVVKKVLARVEENEHKRRPPPVAKLLKGRRTTAGPSIYTSRRL